MRSEVDFPMQGCDSQDEQKIIERASELRLTAYHECSHAAVYQHFGIISETEFYRAFAHPSKGDVGWIGICTPVTWEVKLTPQQNMLVCIGGFVGEQLMLTKLSDENLDKFEDYYCQFDESDIFRNLCDAIDLRTLSESDRDGILLNELCDDHVNQVIQILNSNWEQIETDSLDLISQVENAVSTSGRVFFPASVIARRLNQSFSDPEFLDKFFA